MAAPELRVVGLKDGLNPSAAWDLGNVFSGSTSGFGDVITEGDDLFIIVRAYALNVGQSFAGTLPVPKPTLPDLGGRAWVELADQAQVETAPRIAHPPADGIVHFRQTLFSNVADQDYAAQPTPEFNQVINFSSTVKMNSAALYRGRNGLMAGVDTFEHLNDTSWSESITPRGGGLRQVLWSGIVRPTLPGYTVPTDQDPRDLNGGGAGFANGDGYFSWGVLTGTGTSRAELFEYELLHTLGPDIPIDLSGLVMQYVEPPTAAFGASPALTSRKVVLAELPHQVTSEMRRRTGGTR